VRISLPSLFFAKAQQIVVDAAPNGSSTPLLPFALVRHRRDHDRHTHDSLLPSFFFFSSGSHGQLFHAWIWISFLSFPRCVSPAVSPMRFARSLNGTSFFLSPV